MRPLRSWERTGLANEPANGLSAFVGLASPRRQLFCVEFSAVVLAPQLQTHGHGGLHVHSRICRHSDLENFGLATTKDSMGGGSHLLPGESRSQTSKIGLSPLGRFASLLPDHQF